MLSIYHWVSRKNNTHRWLHLRYACIPVHPLSLHNDILGSCDRATLEMHLEAEINWTERCNWRLWSIEFVDALGGCDRASLEMHLEAEVEWTQRCTWRAWSSKYGHELGGLDRVNTEMNSEAVTDRVWRRTCRLELNEIGGVLVGGQFGGRHDSSWDSIHWLTCNCGNVESWVQHPPRDEKLAGSGSLSILGWCCTRCMLYSVLTHDDGMER